MHARAVRVGAASLDQTVGDWSGNRARLARACDEARSRGVAVLALPELATSGYSLGDRVAMVGTLERSWASVVALRPHTAGLVVPLGLPVAHGGALYDAVAVVADGRVVGIVPKENLATGDVEYESRWYAGWQRGRVDVWEAPDGSRVPFGSLWFDVEGLGGVAVEVCEDGWKGLRPGSVAAIAGARIVVNASASWFQIGKHAIRRSLVEGVSREDRVAYLYASLVGCDATRLVFDGSTFVAADGLVLAEGDRLRMDDDVHVIDAVVDLAALDRGRVTEGSWRQQEAEAARGAFGPLPTRVPVAGRFPVPDVAPPPPPYWVPPTERARDPSLGWLAEVGAIPGPLSAEDVPHVELELALCLGLSDYLRKTGARGVTLALSGGRDSTMCALLVARALRYRAPAATRAEHRAAVRATLTTAYLATAQSGAATRGAASATAEALGAEHLEVAIQETVDLHRRLVEGALGHPLSWDEPVHDLALQNVQARLRASLIWMVANVRGHVLLTTSNKSEAAVGYTTMDGDSAGGLAPLADVPKSLVSAWLAWARRRHDLPFLDLVLATPPTAELRPGAEQTDEGDLMPFAILDRLMYHFAFLGEEPAVLFRRLWPEVAPAYGGDPRAFAAHVRRFVGMFCRAQWKRERFAISFRVTAFDLDPKTGFRFPAVQAPFVEELADLDAAVAEIVGG